VLKIQSAIEPKTGIFAKINNYLLLSKTLDASIEMNE
jgi:hypothetical protein